MSNFQLVKVQDAQPMGEYSPTQVDDHKNKVDMLLLQVNPKIVESNHALRGRGIKPINDLSNIYQVTDKAWVKLQNHYTWAPDF